MSRVTEARAAANESYTVLADAERAVKAARAQHRANMAELHAAKAEATAEADAQAVEGSETTTVYPVKVGRGAAVHAAGFVGGDYQEVQNWTACGTTSASLNRAVRRASETPVEITCTRCLKVPAARRR